jgi:hypothetical protein
MAPVGVSPEHDDRVRSRPDARSTPVAAGGLHHRPTRTVAVDLERLSVDTEQSDAVLAMDTAELEEAAPRRRPDRSRPRSVDPRYVQSSPTRGRTVSPEPSPNPLAVEVAERYAKALTLSPDAPALPEPRAPRRSRAAMRDRALDSPARSSGRRRALNPAPDAAAPSRQRAARPAPAESTSRPRGTSAEPALVARRRAPQTAASALRSPAPPTIDEVTGRRTVTIRGRGAERDYGWTHYDSSRRPSRPAHERPGFKPDRAALWAVFLGLLLVLVAATSAHAAVLAHAVR